jgi:hypothetical protein
MLQKKQQFTPRDLLAKVTGCSRNTAQDAIKSLNSDFERETKQKTGRKNKIIDESYASKIRTIVLNANKEGISASVAYIKKNA